MKVADLLEILEEVSGEAVAGDEMNNRLIFGSEDSEVKRVAVCWMPTIYVIKKAIDQGCNVMISHEKLINEPKRNIYGIRNVFEIKSNYERIKLLSKNNITLIRWHTKWDNAKEGNNEVLLELLGFQKEKDIVCGRIARTSYEFTPRELAEYVKKKLNAPYVKYIDINKRIKRIMIIAGAGAKNVEFIDYAVQNKVDALIGGDLTAETISFAYDNNLVVVDPGHQYLEQVGMKKLCEILKKKFNIDCIFIENEKMSDIV